MKKIVLYSIALLSLAACRSSAPQTERLVCAEADMLTFPYSEGDLRVTRHQTITPVPDVEGLEIIETYFVNEGKPVTVQAYEICRTEIEANDTVVWSLQPSSSSARKDWVLPVQQGFYQRNYLGMNNSDYGGGIPMLDIWQRNGGTAIGLFEPQLRMISMPVEWKRYTNTVSMALRYDLPEPVELAQGDTLHCFRAFRFTHQGDFFNALRVFSDYMQANEGVQMRPSEPEAFEPVWCAWGYHRLFTIDEVIGTLDKVAELGFTWVDIDDGYQVAEGDWSTNARFPGGDRDMRRMTDEVHKRGLKAKLWWAPLAADPDTRLVKEHPEMLLKTAEWAPEFITWWNSWYLSPVNPLVDAYTTDLLHTFLDTWGFDGLKIDGQHLNCCMPDYNETSGLNSAYDAPEQMPSYFGKIYDQAQAIKPHAVIQVCPCGCAVNYFLVSQINQAVASDPTCSRQVRMKRKAYAAMAPQLAYYGDHVELTDGGNDFASQIGTGAVIGTKFTYPKDNPLNPEASCLLTPQKEDLLRKWVRIYKEHDLARGQYMNLYTWGFDYPEAHVIAQNGALYYAFYVDASEDNEHAAYEGPLELRGLDPQTDYTAELYTDDDPQPFIVKGSEPVINVHFNRNYLIKLTPNN